MYWTGAGILKEVATFRNVTELDNPSPNMSGWDTDVTSSLRFRKYWAIASKIPGVRV